MTKSILKIKQFKSKKVVLSLILFFAIFLSVLGIEATYAYYNSSSDFSFLGTIIGDFETGSGDINVMIYAENDDGKYNLINSIPSIGYVLNAELTKCPATYTFENNVIRVTSNEIVTCKFYFDKTTDSDIKINIMLEDVGGAYTYNNTLYKLSEIIPAYGYTYDTYVCSNSAAVTNLAYDPVTRLFSFTTNGQNECYAYFSKAAPADINVYVYIQKEAGSDRYILSEYIPSYSTYILSSSKTSYCEDSNGNVLGTTITYENGEIVIATNSAGDCYVYLDVG